MEGRKFIKKDIKEENGKRYSINTFELAEIPIKNKDIDLLYETVMCDDYECAYDNGLYSDISNEFSYLDIKKVSQRIEEYIHDYEDENGEKFEDLSDAIRIKELLKIFKKHEGFNIYL